MKSSPFALLLLLFLTLHALPADQEKFATPPEAIRDATIPQGKLIRGSYNRSTIFPGTKREYAVYVPAQYEASRSDQALMVFQDGTAFCNDGWGCRAHIVFDHLIHLGEMPVTVGLFIEHGFIPAPNDQAEARYNRSYEYDVMGDAYSRFLIEEFIPFIEKTHALTITKDPNLRGLCGASSGAIAAFTAAWERPDSFRRVYSMIGTYVGLRGGDDYPELIRRTAPKPLRVFLQDGENDLNIYAGDWWMANQAMARALDWSGYEVNHTWGKGGHNHEHGAAIFPEVMRWLWQTKVVTTHLESCKSNASQYLVRDHEWEVVSTGHQGAEGLALSADGSLFFTDATAGKLYKVSPDGTQSLIDGDTGHAVGLALGPDGKIYGAAPGASEIRMWDAITSARQTIATGVKSADIVVHHQGHVYFTDPMGGKIWHLAPSTHQKKVADEFVNPQGIALSADQSLLYVSDFSGRFIYSYQIAEDGSLKYKQPFFYAQLPVNGPTGSLAGMASTTTGELLVASESGIQVCDQPGRVQLVIPRPFPADARPSKVTFGGPGRQTLYLATQGTIYKRQVQLQGAHPLVPNKPPKPSL